MALTLIDSQSEAEGDAWVACNSAVDERRFGQSFNASQANTLHSVKLYMKLGGGLPVGNYYVRIFAHSGTYGSSSVPTGSALASSQPINALTISGTPSFVEFLFTGADRINLSLNTKYCVVLDGTAVGDTSNYDSARCRLFSGAGSHGGNFFYYLDSGTSWNAVSDDEMAFYLYGDTIAEVTTGEITSIAASTATYNGEVLITGGNALDLRGFVYDTVPRSAPGNVAPASSGYANASTESGTYGTGAYTRGVTDLIPDTTYYVRAVVHNANGYVYGSEVSFTTLDSVIATFTDQDPGNIVKAIIDSLQDQGGIIDYEPSSVDLAGYTVSYTFRLQTALEGIRKMLEMSPSNFHWYIDPATGILYFKATSDTADHVLVYKKHIARLRLVQTIENITNIVYFTGGDLGLGENLFAKFINQDSLDHHRQGLGRIADNRVTLYDSAELLANDVLNSNDGPVYRTMVTIPDSVYDIESINLGDTIQFRGFGNFVDNLLLQVVQKTVRPDYLELQIGSLRPRSTTTVETLRRQLEAEQTKDNPDVPE